MLTCLIHGLFAMFLLSDGPAKPSETQRQPLPEAAQGWVVEQVAEVGNGLSPVRSALSAATDGTLFVGLEPMRAPSAIGATAGSIVAIRDGSIRLFADELGQIRGLESLNGGLYVLHGSSLSVLRDTDGNGTVDRRHDLVTGLSSRTSQKSSPEPTTSGICLGIDGRLYFAVDDRGVWNASGCDGQTVQLRGGGILRVRVDGTGLEVFSSGERCPRSVAISASGDVFSMGDPDSSGRWIGGLTHHIDGGRFGYPYHFLNAPFRILPVVGGGFGSSVGQLIAYEEGRLPDAFHGNLFAAVPGSQRVIRVKLQRAGGTFAIASKEEVLQRGKLADFRPVSLQPVTGKNALWIADAASEATRSGRIYRITYTDAGPSKAPQSPQTVSISDRLTALSHPALSVRREIQAVLAQTGGEAARLLVEHLRSSSSDTGRVHSLWALDVLGTDEARAAIRESLHADSPGVRLQASRSCGLQRDGKAVAGLIHLLGDPDPVIRREAAIALGRIGDRAAIEALLEKLSDADRFAAWSIRTAIRRLGYPDREQMCKALKDPARRESALSLADESWSVPVLRALVDSLTATTEPDVRGRMIAALAGQFRAFEEWNGEWWGPNPLAAGFPRKTREWSPEGREIVLEGLTKGLTDRDPTVRFQSVFALSDVGTEAAPLLRSAFVTEADPRNEQAILEAIAGMKDPASIDLFKNLVIDSKRREALRAAALDGLSALPGPISLRVRFLLIYDPEAPPSLVARALPQLAREGFLPPNDLAGFLEHSSELVRAAALLSLNVEKPQPEMVKQLVMARLEDPSTEVRQAAIMAAGAIRLTAAIPQLIAIASKPNAEHRPQAMLALCLMPDPRAAAIYERASRDDDPSLRRAAQIALQKLSPRSDPQTVTASMSNARTVVDPGLLRKFVLDHPGDPRKGEQLFRSHRGISCMRCHAQEGRGHVRIGDSKDSGDCKRTRGELVDALLKPNNRATLAHRRLGKIEDHFTSLELTDVISYLTGPSASAGKPSEKR